MASVVLSGSPAFLAVSQSPARVGRVVLDGAGDATVAIVGVSASSEAHLSVVGGPAFPTAAHVPVASCSTDTLTITGGATAANCVVDYVVFG